MVVGILSLKISLTMVFKVLVPTSVGITLATKFKGSQPIAVLFIIDGTFGEESFMRRLI
jgi:TPP-dependent pyruvate/acetoin dehydrogenase alpha subunit